jgi:hypothetical protein
MGGSFLLHFVKLDESSNEYHFKITNQGWERDLVVKSQDLGEKITWICRLPFDFDPSLIDPKSIVGRCVNKKTEREFEDLKSREDAGLYVKSENLGGFVDVSKYTGWEAISRNVD